MIEFCNKNNLIILNGNHWEDEVGQFTFTNKSGSSVIDFALCSVEIYHEIKRFQILQLNSSHHAALHLEIENINKTNNIISKFEYKKLEICKHYKWNETKVHEYYKKLNNEYSKISLIGIQTFIESNKIDKALNIITNVINNAANNMIVINTHKTNLTNEITWYDEECQKAKNEFKDDFNNWRKDYNNEHRNQFLERKNKYKKLIKLKKEKFSIKFSEKINILINTNNSKELWNYLKRIYVVKNENIQNNINI